MQLGASYSVSLKASERLAESRVAVALLLKAERPEEIALGPSTTTMMRLLATAMASPFQPGNEIVLTVFDHDIGPC